MRRRLTIGGQHIVDVTAWDVCVHPPRPSPTHTERGGRGRERLIKTESRETDSGKESVCKNSSARESLWDADSENVRFHTSQSSVWAVWSRAANPGHGSRSSAQPLWLRRQWIWMKIFKPQTGVPGMLWTIITLIPASKREGVVFCFSESGLLGIIFFGSYIYL